MRKTVYETNFDRLVKLGVFVDGHEDDARKSAASSLMDLTVERRQHMDGLGPKKGLVYSLAHTFIQNGDLCMDPAMDVIVYPESNMVEALTFEMSLPPVYQVVYPEPGRYFPKLKSELNSFLRQWLNNLLDQGHGKHWEAY